MRSSGGFSVTVFFFPPVAGKTLWLWFCSDHRREVVQAFGGWHAGVSCSGGPQEQRLQPLPGHVVGRSHHLRQVGGDTLSFLLLPPFLLSVDFYFFFLSLALISFCLFLILISICAAVSVGHSLSTKMKTSTIRSKTLPSCTLLTPGRKSPRKVPQPHLWSVTQH